MTVIKSFGLYEGVRFDLRFDFFNLFNSVNFRAPGNGINITSPLSLTMRSLWTEPPRTIQVGGRITF